MPPNCRRLAYRISRVEILEAGNQTESETRETLMASDRLVRIELSLSLSVEANALSRYGVNLALKSFY